jgi:hypothetical protein
MLVTCRSTLQRTKYSGAAFSAVLTISLEVRARAIAGRETTVCTFAGT